MDALRDKKVIQEIPRGDTPTEAHPVKTMWVYAVKTDYGRYVIRFKARIVALGNYQRPGIDFGDTFALVGRMSSFLLLLVLAAEQGLQVYDGDVNMAYLNASLTIKQYISNIEGYPPKA